MNYYSGIYYGVTMEHHGIKGMKWGIRRYQNEDGSLTAAGRERYGLDTRKNIRNNYKVTKSNIKAERAQSRDELSSKENREMLDISKTYRPGQKMSEEDLKKEKEIEEKYSKLWKDNEAKYKSALAEAKKNYKEDMKNAGAGLTDKQKKMLIAAGAAVTAGLAVYGAYKISEKNASNLFKDFDNSINKGHEILDNFLQSKGKDFSGGTNYEYTKFTNGDYEAKVMNPYYEKSVNAREKLNKNIYNRITGTYDEALLRSIPSDAYTKRSTDSSNKKLNVSSYREYRRDDIENRGTLREIKNRLYKRNYKSKNHKQY